MTKKKSETPFENMLEGVKPFAFFDPNELSKISGRNMELATRVARAYMTGVSRLNQEVMATVNKRIKKDMDAAQTIMSSKSGEEAVRAQSEFVQEAMKDYTEEASRLFKLVVEMTQETMANAEDVNGQAFEVVKKEDPSS